MRKLLFTPLAFDQYNNWQTENKQVFSRLKNLLTEIARTPYEGKGKPEPLKYEYSGSWSRRLTEEHRIVYTVFKEWVEIISCKYHYQ